MTDTTHRPLPTNLGLLRQHWLPAEPHGTTVTLARQALATVDAAVSATHAELTVMDNQDQATVSAIVDAAARGKDPTAAAATAPSAGDRTALTQRLDLLRRARQLASTRVSTAEHSDPDHLAWLAQCRDITALWQQAQSAETDSERYEALLAFTHDHATIN